MAVIPMIEGQAGLAEAGPPEADVIRQAQLGSLEAMAALYDAHQAAIFAYFRARVSDPLAAEDLTAEVFKRMLVALRNYRLQSFPFRAWLFRIARNLLVDTYRRERREIQVDWQDNGHLAGHSPELSAVAAQALTLEKVRQALARLEPGQREAITLRFLSGLSVRDTAVAMEKSEDAVKALQRRGLAALRRALPGEWQ
jgi:RNA polymerase sigma-70 factor (ECF subfamily)